MTEDTPRPSGIVSEAASAFTVVVPAVDEEARVGDVVRECWRGGAARVIVAEGGSTDRTVDVASEAGAEVVAVSTLAPGGASLGKGDALWRAVALVDTPITVFLDGDLFIDGAEFLSLLIAPLTVPTVVLSKASFERVRPSGIPPEPGRITQLVAQPLLGLLHPSLARMTEPLSGQIAARTEVLRQLSFEVDYGLEIGMLLDVVDRFGPESVAHPDCGVLGHLSQTEAALGAMSAQVMSAALRRAEVAAPGDTRPPARPPHDPPR
ncbi:MAG: glycosyltransferase [Actinomycetes bacterium]